MLRAALMLVFGLVLLGSAAYGQGTANIVGTVTDPTGAVVPNAKITITNSDTGFIRTTTAGSVGVFRAADLQNGRYVLQVEAEGFKTYERKNITLDVGATVRADVALQIGAVGQSVTVEAAALQVQAVTNDVSQTINANQIENLGTNGRNIKQLAVLVPGANNEMPDFDSPGAQFQSTSIYFNGMRSDDNNWVIDGGEAYDRGGGGILVVAPSQDALSEFTISTSNYSADMGLSSGGMTSMAIKNGAKKFHVSGWEYDRNDALDAWDYYQKQTAGAKKPELRYNVFGFNGGGPIEFRSRNPKSFFFYNQEWRREINGGGIHNKVLTASELAGDESAFLQTGTQYPIFVPMVTSASPLYAKIIAAGLQPGQQFSYQGKLNVIPPSMINANTAAYIKAGYFLPPNDSSGVYYNSSANQATYMREEIARVDHQFNEKYSIFGHLIYDSLSQQAATVSWSGNTFPTIGSLETVPSWAGVVHFTANLTPHLLNEIAYNENGNDITIANTGPLVKAPSGWSPQVLFGTANPANKIPDVNMSGPISDTMDSSNWPWQNWWRSNQIKDDVSYIHGSHSFKAGFGWLWTSKKQQLFANTAGSLNFYGGGSSCSTTADPANCPGNSSTVNVNGLGIADFLLGAVSSYNQTELQDFVNIHFNSIDAYLNDDWRVSPRLTLNLGIRWEALPHAYDANGRASNFYPSLWQSGNQASFAGVGTSGAIDAAKSTAWQNATGALCTSNSATGCTTANLSAFKTGSSLGVTLANDTFYMNGVGLAGKNGVPKGLIPPHYYNFGPRIGFAYDLFGNQKTILRAGTGVFFERNAGNEEYNMGSDLPFTNSGSSGSAYLDNLSQSYINGTKLPPAAVTAQGFTGLQEGEPISDVYQWSVGLQQQMKGNMVGTLAYVGNTSAHLSDTVDINTTRAADTATRTVVCGSYCGGPGSIPTNNVFRPYQGWGGINLLGDEENSHYGSLQGTLRATAWHSINLGMAYTYSHTWDGIDGQIWNNISDPLNPKYDKGTAGFDRRQMLSLNFDYTLPNFNLTGVGKTVLGGWGISGIGSVETGLPANVGNQGDPTGCGGDCTSRANQSGPVSYPKSKSVVNSQYKWVDLAPFSSAAPLTFGNAAKNSIKGIGRDDWSLSLHKDFKFTESAGFSFVAESYNAFNHTQFSGFDTNYAGSTPGQVNGVQGNSFRTFQLGARLYY